MLKIGDFYELDLIYTQQQVNDFAAITGDNNPLHIDPEYAKTTRFGRPVIHGFLAGAVFSRIFGTLFPGEGTIYIYQDMRFREPIFVDKTYKARVEITEINTEKHNGTVSCLLLDPAANPEHRVCIEGTARMKHLTEFV
ncbi:MAG: MaoC family dehydratase [Prevotellaceae bacterium]|jgi:acyl dehydratase|nr:MaoC family dehydratase [Prevotellaceae bacterium]